MNIQSIKNFARAIDLENMQRGQLKSDPGAKIGTIALNSAHAVLAGASAIPGVSVVSGAVQMIFGFWGLLGGFTTMVTMPDPEQGVAIMASGVKSAALGAAAAFLPGIGNVINAAVAAGDTIDAAMAYRAKP